MNRFQTNAMKIALQMSKRSPTSDVEDSNSMEDDFKPSSSKKPRIVAFEPVRLISVSGVNDIDQRVDRFKLVKLAERLKFKQRLLEEEKRKVERLTARQDKDDNTLCTINRHWNRLDLDIRMTLSRLGGGEVVVSQEGEGESSAEFLGQIAQMDDDECEKTYDARVSHTQRLASQLVDLESRRSEKFASLCKKIKEAIEKAGESAGISTDLAEKIASLAEENKQLARSVHKLQLESRELSLKAREREDRIALLETKNEELRTELDEKDFELQKSWRREEKLDMRLGQMAKELTENEKKVKPEKIEANGVHEAGPTADISQTKLEELQWELETAKETLAVRLQEMTDMNEKSAEMTAELEKTKMELRHIPSSVIRESEEYVNLQAFYTLMVEEVQRMKEEKESLYQQNEELKKRHEEQVKEMVREEQISQSRLMHNSAELEKNLAEVRKDFEKLVCDMEHVAEAQQQLSRENHGADSVLDYAQMWETLKNQQTVLKADSARMKHKWQDAVSALMKYQAKFGSEVARLEKFLLIPLSEDVPDMNVKEMMDGVSEKKEGENGEKKETKDKDAIIAQLQHEVKVLEVQLKSAKLSLTKLISKEEREKMWGDDAQRRIRDLEKRVDDMKKTLEEKVKEEEGLMNEMESTGQAYEELQEVNNKILLRLKEADEQNLKAVLEEQVTSLTNALHSQKLELNHSKECVTLAYERQNQLSMENDKLYSQNEQLRRLQMQESKRVHEMKVAFEKCSTQLQEAQQAMKAKFSGHVKDEFRIRRLEEEKSILKKRLERVKKTELIGSADAVLMEEIKELKDVLTCPSCKVRRKDGILTKCFHVFCMDCLKNRYEARRRKCPKCNAAFGANDFHRVYIG